jgi:hypothetical protein
MYALGLMSTTSLHSVLCLLHLALAERTMSTFGKIMSRIFHHDAATDWDGERRNCCTDRRDSDIKGSLWGAPRHPSMWRRSSTESVDGRAEARLEAFDRRSHEAARPRQQPHRTQTARRRACTNTGHKNDSAQMNVWLHRQVMVKLAENGGKVRER